MPSVKAPHVLAGAALAALALSVSSGHRALAATVLRHLDRPAAATPAGYVATDLGPVSGALHGRPLGVDAAGDVLFAKGLLRAGTFIPAPEPTGVTQAVFTVAIDSAGLVVGFTTEPPPAGGSVTDGPQVGYWWNTVSGATSVSLMPGSSDTCSTQTEFLATDDQGEAGGDAESCPGPSQEGVAAESPGATPTVQTDLTAVWAINPDWELGPTAGGSLLLVNRQTSASTPVTIVPGVTAYQVYDEPALGANGSLVGEASSSEMTPVIQEPDGTVQPLPNSGNQTGTAAAIDTAGQIVGNLGSSAVIWPSAASAPVDLNTLLPTGSPWQLEDAFAIGSSGDVLGAGTLDGASHYVLLTPEKAISPAPAPTSTAAPKISGTPRKGSTLSCSTGSWTGGPTRFTYAWSLDGTPIPGADSSVLTVQALYEGTTLSCAVLAANAVGTGGPATSASVRIPVPLVKRCPAATGSAKGTTIGLLRLGMTRARARRAYTKSSDRGKRYQDFFCLTPRGVRVGYASPKLLKTLPARSRHRYSGRVIWASTSSEQYAIHGIRPEATVASAARALKLGKVFIVGLNDWYLAPDGAVTAVFKARHGIIEEIGIATRALTTSRSSQRVFLTSFS